MEDALSNMSNPQETDGTQGRWALISRNLMAGYGLFPTELDAWNYAVKQGLASEPHDRRRVDTVPLIPPSVQLAPASEVEPDDREPDENLPTYDIQYWVSIEEVPAHDHNDSMNRKVAISVTVDGEPWPAVRREWDQTWEYKDGKRYRWALDCYGEEDEDYCSNDEEEEANDNA